MAVYLAINVRFYKISSLTDLFISDNLIYAVLKPVLALLFFNIEIYRSAISLDAYRLLTLKIMRDKGLQKLK